MIVLTAQSLQILSPLVRTIMDRDLACSQQVLEIEPGQPCHIGSFRKCCVVLLKEGDGKLLPQFLLSQPNVWDFYNHGSWL